VIGSSSTFGKGTVQRQIPLNFDGGKLLEGDDYGSIKVTLQKFYRINGGSTQLKGVTPDIVIPDTYEYLKFREKDTESAMKWDEISKAGFSEWKVNPDFEFVKKSSVERINNNSAFKLIRENSAWLNEQSDKENSLNLDKYREEQKKIKSTSKQIEGLLKNNAPLSVSFMKEDETKYLGEKDKADRNNNFLKALSTDIYLNEAVKVVQDMIKVQNLALNNR
jgi:carboxyl-terminal processing protease